MADDTDSTLVALAEPTRRRIIDLLRERPRPVGELATAARMSGPAISRHLQVLRRSGLIEEERVEEDARIRVYRLRPEPFADLQAWLDQVQAFWTDRLGAFKAYGERAQEGERP